jgi:hypothetical protein
MSRRRAASLVLSVVVTLVVAACGGAPSRSTSRTTDTRPTENAGPSAAQRASAALLDEATSFAARISVSSHPSPGAPGWVAPPTEAELAWVTDRAIPMAQRFERAEPLLEASSRIIHAYFDAGIAFSGGLLWASSIIRQQSALLFVLLDELLPTIPEDDPTYPVRLDGLRRMGNGAVEMTGGLLSVLREPGIDRGSRLEVADAMRDHIANLARAMTSEQRAQVAAVLAETHGAERDAEIAATLGEAHAALLSNR